MKEINVCSLCLQNNILRESHIIPKFAVKWIKETGTGFLVNAEDGSERIQDGIKLQLLCDICEEKFSKFEKYFADNVFYPFHNNKIRTFDYDENLELFIISLSWRVLKATEQNFKLRNPHLNSFVAKAELCWRTFLNGNTSTLDQYENHLAFVGRIGNIQNKKTRNELEWYNCRSVDFEIVTYDKKILAYAKLPWMISVTSIHPKTLEEWKGTLIKKIGKISHDQSIEDRGFGDFLLGRASLALNLSEGPSPEIVEKRFKRVMEKNPKKFHESHTYRLLMDREDLQIKDKIKNMPNSIVILVEHIMLANDNPQLSIAENKTNKLNTKRFINKIANLSEEASRTLAAKINTVIEKSRISKNNEQFTFTTNSLWITFIVTPNVTRENQHVKILGEITRLRKQTDDKIPIAVFSCNPESNLESGFFMPSQYNL